MDALLNDIRFQYAVLKAALLLLERRAETIPRRVAVAKRMALTRQWMALDRARGSAVSHEQAQAWIAAFGVRLGLDAKVPEEGLLLYITQHNAPPEQAVLNEASSLLDEVIAAEA